MAGTTMTEQDHARIAEAIRAAEESTAGEIYCVVARRSDGYFFSAAMAVTISILVISLGVAFLIEAWWLTMRLPVFVGAQLAGARGGTGARLCLAWVAHQAGAPALAIHARA